MAYIMGIEVGVEPLITPSHLMLFLGAFLMSIMFASRPENSLDFAAIFSAATSYGQLCLLLLLNPKYSTLSFLFKRWSTGPC